MQQLVPPPADGGIAVDWARITESWGRAFPPDYVRFMQVYGPGAVQNYLSIDEPEPKLSLSQARRDGMVVETANAEADWESEDKSPELEGISPLLITWGVDATADLLCWDASGPDPASWPVLVYKRGDMRWSRYDCGMAEFLVRVLRADFPECPLGAVFMWGVTDALFEKKRG
ncbi:SMI1/KNR4 family protein [Nonomuraea angiospora]